MTQRPMNSRRLSGCTVVLFLAVALIWPVTGAADQVRTRAWSHAQFGRIVFDWPSPVKFRANVSTDTLTVTFDRAIATSFDFVRRNLSRYIADIALSEDGKSVVAKLSRPFRIRSFANEQAVVVDLMDPTAATSGAAATGSRKVPATSSGSKVATGTPLLVVRTGEHLGFGRIVFDWTGVVVYSVGKSNGQVVVRFDRAARIDLAALKSVLPKPLSDVTSSLDRGRLAVRLTAPGNSRIRHFRDGSKVVVDILAGVERTAENKPKHRPVPQRAVPALSPGAAPAKNPPRPLALIPNVNRNPGAKSKSKRKRKPRLRRHAKQFGPQAAIVTLKAQRTRNDLAVTFNWRRPVAAVAFIRNSRLWLAFDTPARIALGPMRAAGTGIIKHVEQYPQQDATILGFSVPARYEAQLTRDGARWKLELKNRNPDSRQGGGLAVRVDAGSDGRPRVVVPVKAAGKPIRFRDPDVGDALVAIALADPDQRLVRGRSFVEFTLLPTIHGVAIRQVSEDVVVAVDKFSVVISRPEGLYVSRPEELSGHGAQSEIGRALWNMADWRRGSRDDFQRNKLALMNRIITAPPSRRNEARMDLAKFYLAHGMAADAVGVVQTVMRQRPSAQQLITLRALRGASSYLLGHYGDASVDLDHRHLKDEPGVAPWRAAIAAKRGDWRSANDRFTGTEQALARLPRRFAVRFKLMAFEAALASDDLPRAKRLVEALRLEQLPPGKLEYLNLLRGYLLKKDNKPKKALEIWNTLTQSDNRLVRAKATFARIETLRDLKEMEPGEAVIQLDKLSFAWRGDAYEFDLLRRLGELYVAGKDYRSGLIRLRQAASYFENVEGADAVAKLMADYFKKLYLDGAADDLPPVRALALYEEFRELTPPGVEGEKMVRRLADRLANVDLLDEAAELLSHQIEFRLTGQEKARVAARLAEIRLLDREPNLALETLKNSDADDLPKDLVNERRRIKARALGELKRPDEAMDTLKDDLGRAADEIRLGILWSAGNWRETADILQRSMGFRGVEAGNDDEAQRVLRWAVALAMVDDVSGLAALRNRFLADMSASKFAKPFRAIVGSGTGDVRDYKALAEQIGDLDNLKSFLSSFREEVQSARRDTAN